MNPIVHTVPSVVVRPPPFGVGMVHRFETMTLFLCSLISSLLSAISWEETTRFVAATFSSAVPFQPRGVNVHKRVVVAVGVPVASGLRRVAAQEAPYAGVVVPVAKQQQPGGRVCLVAAGARKLHRGRGAAAARERLAKRIVKQCVSRGAGAASYAARTA